MEEKLLAVEGEFMVMEDMSGNQHRGILEEAQHYLNLPNSPEIPLMQASTKMGNAQLTQ